MCTIQNDGRTYLLNSPFLYIEARVEQRQPDFMFVFEWMRKVDVVVS